METQTEFLEFNKASQKTNTVQRIRWSIGVAIFTGLLTFILTSVLRNKSKDKDDTTTKVDYENLPENDLDKIDAGRKVFKVRDALRNKLYLRARRRFITG